jgi:hypothetical protein
LEGDAQVGDCGAGSEQRCSCCYTGVQLRTKMTDRVAWIRQMWGA